MTRRRNNCLKVEIRSDAMDNITHVGTYLHKHNMVLLLKNLYCTEYLLGVLHFVHQMRLSVLRLVKMLSWSVALEVLETVGHM